MAKKSTKDASSAPETPATPVEDVPGELLADSHLVDPGEYEIAADETEAEELTDVEPEPDEDVVEDPEQLVEDPEQLDEAEAVAAVAASSRPVRKVVRTGEVAPKDRATPRRRGSTAVVERKRTTPLQFTKESAAELRKVIWPTWDQLRQYFVAVLIFVLLIIAFVGGLDLLFGQLLLKALGQSNA